MATTTPAHRIPAQDVCMSEAMQFAQHWEVRVPVPIADLVDVGAALQAVASRLRAGDKVTICAFQDKSYAVLTEIAEYRVVGGQARAQLFKTYGPVKVPTSLRDAATAVDERLTVRDSGGLWEVVDRAGHVIESFVDKGQADGFAARENARAGGAKKVA